MEIKKKFNILDQEPFWRLAPLKKMLNIRGYYESEYLSSLASFITHQVQHHNLLFTRCRCLIYISSQDFLFSFIVAFINYNYDVFKLTYEIGDFFDSGELSSKYMCKTE
jgi:hypothetical protein